jgi:hypothetical protein
MPKLNRTGPNLPSTSNLDTCLRRQSIQRLLDRLDPPPDLFQLPILPILVPLDPGGQGGLAVGFGLFEGGLTAVWKCRASSVECRSDDNHDEKREKAMSACVPLRRRLKITTKNRSGPDLPSLQTSDPLSPLNGLLRPLLFPHSGLPCSLSLPRFDRRRNLKRTC